MKPLALVILFTAAMQGSEIVGQWRGQRGNLPLVDLTVREARGTFFGTVVFYVNRDGQVVAQEERPLADAKFDGSAFTFRIVKSFEGLTAFELKPAGDGTAVLRATNPGAGEAVAMRRLNTHRGGVWEGRINGLPAIEPTIEQNPAHIGPNVNFRVEFTASNDALLRRGNGPEPLKLARRSN